MTPDALERRARLAFAAGFLTMLVMLVVVRPTFVEPVQATVPTLELPPVPDTTAFDAALRVRRQRLAFELGVFLAVHDEACAYAAEGVPAAAALLATSNARLATLRGSLGLDPEELACGQDIAPPALISALGHELSVRVAFGHSLYALDMLVWEIGSLPPALQKMADDLAATARSLAIPTRAGQRADLPYVHAHLLGRPWGPPDGLEQAREEHKQAGDASR